MNVRFLFMHSNFFIRLSNRHLQPQVNLILLQSRILPVGMMQGQEVAAAAVAAEAHSARAGSDADGSIDADGTDPVGVEYFPAVSAPWMASNPLCINFH